MLRCSRIKHACLYDGRGHGPFPRAGGATIVVLSTMRWMLKELHSICEFLFPLDKVYQEQKSGSRGVHVQCDKLFPIRAVVLPKAQLTHIRFAKYFWFVLKLKTFFGVSHSPTILTGTSRFVWREVKATLQPQPPPKWRTCYDVDVGVDLKLGS